MNPITINHKLSRQISKVTSLFLLLSLTQPAWAQLTGNAVIHENGPTAQTPIRVVYPTPESKIDASSSFIVGCCQPGDSLTCNGAPVRMNKQGFFAHVIPVKPGDNKFTLVESGTVQATREVHAIKEIEAPPLSADKLVLLKDSFQPAQDLAVVPGDLVIFKVRASVGSEVTVTLDGKSINLRTLDKPAPARNKRPAKPNGSGGAGKISINGGMAVAYGKTFQRSAHERSDEYHGFYKIAADDRWDDVQAKISARLNGKSQTCVSNARFKVMHQPFLAETTHDDTIVRVGANAGRTTPLVKGIRLLVDGWQGEQMRCLYATNKHFWIARQDLAWENGQPSNMVDKKAAGTPGPAPVAVARTINVVDDEIGSYIALPLTQRLPYQVIQSIKPNTLTLKLYGVTADTDWVSDPHLSASQDGDEVKTLPKHRPIENITWSQAADGLYEVTVNFEGHRQWGFKVDYEGTELRLHVRRAPRLDKNSTAAPLGGLKICVDPGHGGKELGAIGPSGVTESWINLAISLKLRTLLEKAGAQVVMTRTGDQDVSLDERVRIANANKVDILMSVHNNSLPDGRDPWRERGTSTYWYHPQSTELGRCLKAGMLGALKLPELGNRFQNLALARPSFMPAVLSEVGFVINPDEYAILISPEGQDAAAQGLCQGLCDYFRGQEHKSADH